MNYSLLPAHELRRRILVKKQRFQKKLALSKFGTISFPEAEQQIACCEIQVIEFALQLKEAMEDLENLKAQYAEDLQKKVNLKKMVVHGQEF